MDTLFSAQERERNFKRLPLAVRMRPRTLEEYAGQQEAVGEGSWLRMAIEHDVLTSVILYGPAGTGKTSLAHVIAHTTHAEFVEVSAVSGTVKDLRHKIEEAKRRWLTQERRTILFVDEIHRFSRSQQDALLHAVEDRTVVLIGATTENPYFEVNSALLSRSRVVELHPLEDKDIEQIIDRALTVSYGLDHKYQVDEEAEKEIVTLAGGDARSALTTLELAAQIAQTGHEKAKDETQEPLTITKQMVREANPRPGLAYDKAGDMHYDIISAFIKSMRGSDPDATIYWLARMVDAGEDPKFIARRIMICASEDIGNADPNAILVAAAAFRAVEVIGYPECQINLAQAALYNALAPKSNAAVSAIYSAVHEVREGPRREVPNHLRDRHRPGSENYGEYKYPHDYPTGWVHQQYLPDGLKKGDFYRPRRGWESWIVEANARDRSEGPSTKPDK